MSFSNDSKWRDGAVLAGAALIALFLMSQRQASWMEELRPWLSVRLARWEGGLRDVGRMATLKAENGRLKADLAGRQWNTERLNALEMENRRLRQLLGLKQRADVSLIAGEVVVRPELPWPGLAQIRLLSSDSVRVGAPVLTVQGVAGKVVSVEKGHVSAQLLHSPQFRLGVRVQRSRVYGIVRWLYGNRLAMEGVPVTADVRKGDRIVTSGLSLYYPADLLVGHVLEVHQDDKALFKEVLVAAAVRYESLEDVVVLGTLPQEKEAPDEE